ncbi:MAG: Gfo/Idh/MocA family oxidoreductase [Oscillospiraceae bacterium]|nr:Gfo/Idh/MocA family oxidoreductase [Oscillospiraceae bacterium]
MTHRFGIIGYGGMAGYHHANSLKYEEFKDEFKYVAAYDINPERLELAEKKGLIAYKTAEELLADESIDTVLIATYNNFHHDYAIAAMRAGKNVICEKPVAMNAAELEEMIAVSKETGKVFTVHQNRRWDKDFNIVKKAYESGVLGDAYTFESRVHGANGAIFGWRRYKEMGGGMLLDWGVHMLDQLLFMFGDEKVVEVYAQFANVTVEEVDDYCKVILKFESGKSATVEVGTTCYQPLPRWFVSGSKGTLVVKNWECEGSILCSKNTETVWEPIVIQTVAGPTRTMAPRPKETMEEIPLPEADPHWTDYYHNVVAAIEGREELIVKPEQALRVLKVIDAAFACADGTGSIKVNI